MILTKTQLWLALCFLFLATFIAYYSGRQSITTEEITNTSSSTIKTEVATGTKPSTIKAPSTGDTKATTGFSTYTNSEYGFTIKYPTYSKVKTTFSTFHQLGNNWRLYPGAAVQGKPVVSFTVFSVDQGVYSTGKQTYPLYYISEVRIGTSANTKECYASDPGYTNQKITNVVINGTNFKKFSTSDGGMMKYVQAESYRTVKNNVCLVIEQIKNGSIYRDELMTVGVTDATMDAHYATGDTIVKSFAFTR